MSTENLTLSFSNDFDKDAKLIRSTMLRYAAEKKELPEVTSQQLAKKLMQDMKQGLQQLESLRTSDFPTNRRALDVSLGQFASQKWGFSVSELNQSPESFYNLLGINPAQHTINSFAAMADFPEAYRWLVPEIVREAIRLGLRKNPLYPNLIAADESVTQPTIYMPYINLSDAMPSKIGEAETIPVGTASFGQKQVGLQKVGTGLSVTDEVRQYVSLNILSLYLQDVGVMLNLAQDSLAIQTLVNGDGNANAAPVIGVENTTNGIQYIDLLRAWLQMGQLGRLPTSMLSNGATALKILTLPEMVKTYNLLAGIETKNPIKVRTPLPTSQSYDVHGAAPTGNQLMLIDNTSALIRLTSAALRVETDRNAERQLDTAYVSLTTGFAKMFTDATIIINGDVAFTSAGFPAYMDVEAFQRRAFKVS